MTDGISAKMFRVAGCQYEEGQLVSFPDTQFNDFLLVGLVALPVDVGDLPEPALPVPGDTKARKGSTKGSDL